MFKATSSVSACDPYIRYLLASPSRAKIVQFDVYPQVEEADFHGNIVSVKDFHKLTADVAKGNDGHAKTMFELARNSSNQPNKPVAVATLWDFFNSKQSDADDSVDLFHKFAAKNKKDRLLKWFKANHDHMNSQLPTISKDCPMLSAIISSADDYKEVFGTKSEVQSFKLAGVRIQNKRRETEDKYSNRLNTFITNFRKDPVNKHLTSDEIRKLAENKCKALGISHNTHEDRSNYLLKNMSVKYAYQQNGQKPLALLFHEHPISTFDPGKGSDFNHMNHWMLKAAVSKM